MKLPAYEEQAATSGEKQNGECPDFETSAATPSRLSTRMWTKVESRLGGGASSSSILWHGLQGDKRLRFGSKERVVLASGKKNASCRPPLYANWSKPCQVILAPSSSTLGQASWCSFDFAQAARCFSVLNEISISYLLLDS